MMITEQICFTAEQKVKRLGGATAAAIICTLQTVQQHYFN